MKNAQTSAFTIDSTESITAPFNWGAINAPFWTGFGIGLGIALSFC